MGGGCQKPGQAAKPQVSSIGSSVAAVGPTLSSSTAGAALGTSLQLSRFQFSHPYDGDPSPIYLGSLLGLSYIYVVLRMVVVYDIHQ